MKIIQQVIGSARVTEIMSQDAGKTPGMLKQLFATGQIATSTSLKLQVTPGISNSSFEPTHTLLQLISG